MKNMNDKKMDMGKGSPNSEGFFPENAHNKALPRAGEMRHHKYPDTEESVHAAQNQAVKATNANMAKAEFRH